MLGIKHSAIAVKNLKKSLDFFTKTFNFHAYHIQDLDWAMICKNGTSLSLVPVPEKDWDKAFPKKLPHGGSHPAHLGFVVETEKEVEEMYSKLQTYPECTVGKPKKHRDGSYGFYFQDFDGNQFELISIPYISQITKSPKRENEAIVLLAHGSSDEEWKKPIEKIKEKLTYHASFLSCEIAYLEKSTPDLKTAAKNLFQKNNKLSTLHIVPLFLSPGGVHMKKDIPHLVGALQKDHPGVSCKLHPSLGESNFLQEMMSIHVLEKVFYE